MNFGRRVSVDPKDQQFLMRRKMAAPGTPIVTRKTWPISSTSIDQGDTSTCVGHAWKNFLRCAPMKTMIGPSPWDIYRKAVLDDEWTGNDAEAKLPDGDVGLKDGTSVRAGAQAVTELGRLKSFIWAFELQPAIEWVLTQGPLVLGINWYSSMMSPDAKGIIKITPGASVVGGHAILCRGIDLKHSLALLENSWGDGWGKNGGCYLPLADLERLIHEQGECCAAVEMKLQPVKSQPKGPKP